MEPDQPVIASVPLRHALLEGWVKQFTKVLEPEGVNRHSQTKESWGWAWLTECLPHIQESLGSIPISEMAQPANALTTWANYEFHFWNTRDERRQFQ